MHLTKAQAENAHAKRRAFERLGANLNKENRRILIRAIQKGELMFIRKQSKRVSVFRCIINDQLIDVVYDRQRKRVVTFLFPTGGPGYEEYAKENTMPSKEDDSDLPPPTPNGYDLESTGEAVQGE